MSDFGAQQKLGFPLLLGPGRKSPGPMRAPGLVVAEIAALLCE